MPRILRTPEARQDLLDIWTYIARQNAPAIADRVLARIYGALDVLAQAPLIGRERLEFAGQPRSFAVRPYVILYEPLVEGDGILVWRVVHGARNLRRAIIPPDR